MHVKRVMVLSVLSLSALGLAACSSGSGTPTTKAGSGAAVLGATTAVWQSGHPANADGYGSSVTINGKTTPQFTSVKESSGRVVGFHMTFPAHTKLPAAESLVRNELPKDARQTASGRSDFAQATTYCEFVNYQSAKLAGSLGTPVPTGAEGNIGVVLYEITPKTTGSSSIATVNAADVSTTPVAAGQRC